MENYYADVIEYTAQYTGGFINPVKVVSIKTVQEYTVGFMFDLGRSHVALIRKLHPEWQRDKINGIGGKVEVGEWPLAGMIREFYEETGVAWDKWQEFATLSADKNPRDGGDAWKIYYYRAFTEDVWKVRSLTDEKVQVYNVRHLLDGKYGDMVYHLPWIVEMALNTSSVYDMVERV